MGFLTYQQLGQVLVLACCALVLLVLARCRLEELDTMTLWAAYCTMFAWFMFATRVHERYLFPAVVFLTALVLYTRIAAVVLAVLSITFLANLVWVYDLENTGMDWAWLNTDPAVRMIAAINLVLLAVSLFIPFVHRFTRGRSRTALSATRRVNVRRRATVTRRAPGPRWRELH